jgi:alkanesulfonate monooxygenase SsuD/methylene tetrahydromethanopterin reductase-like flavin-dependent oxidoreductase (luciferase family)
MLSLEKAPAEVIELKKVHHHLEKELYMSTVPQNRLTMQWVLNEYPRLIERKTVFVQMQLLISAVGLKAFRLAGEIADGALPWVSPVPYLLESALPELRAGAEIRSRPAPPVIAYVQVALSLDEAKVQVATRKLARRSMHSVFYTRMFAKAGFAKAVEGDEAALDALARALVISGDETTVHERIQELLASGLDELLLHLVPIADEENERKQLLHLVGSL